MDSDEDDEEPQNEPGASSELSDLLHQYYLFIKDQQPVRKDQLQVLNSGDEDSEYNDECSAQSQDSERTVLYPDLYVSTNDEH